MKRFILPLLLVFFFLGCSDDDTPVNCDYERELNDFNAKVIVFTNNLTTSNCNSLKQSAIVVLNRMDGCPGSVGIRDAIQEWRDVDCNPFGN